MPSRNSRARSKDLRRAIRYWLVVAPAIAVLSRLPFPVARALGWCAGNLASVLARKARRQALENLELAFGAEKSPRELRRIVRGVFRNTATNVLELLVVHGWSREKVRRHFGLAEDFAAIQRDLPTGTVGMTGHFGNWELLGVLFGAYLPGRSRPVARRIYFPKFQELMERFRTKAGLEIIYTDESPRKLVEAIEGGHILGLLPDQNLKVVNGVFVDFFGKPAYTSTTPVHLALSTGAPLFTCYLVRDGRKYRVLYRIYRLDRALDSSGNRQEALLAGTRLWTAYLEENVRALPDQWVWFHRRWRTRPEDGPRKARRIRTTAASRRAAVEKAQADPPGEGSPLP